MGLYVVVGVQWGDEGKGKVVDYLAPEMHYIVRFQGGANAGHTVTRGKRVFRFHLLPSGCLHPKVTSVIAPGVVADLHQLLKELDNLQGLGIARPRLLISPRVHLVMPYHLLQDELEEKRRGKSSIGTTKRGIGPCYADRAARNGIRLEDLTRPDEFRARLCYILEEKNTLFTHLYGGDALEVDRVADDLLGAFERVAPYLAETATVLREALTEGKNVLFEGAQGALLDLENGTYPYVTSSHTLAVSATLSTGISIRHAKRILGVSKAYLTRVGSGPFPTEIQESFLNAHIREVGGEYGATTGRPRRLGWLDLPLLRYAATVNDLHSLAITKMDVLQDLREIKACVAYRHRGKTLEMPPEDLALLSEVEPVYERFESWSAIAKAPTYADLPRNARRYLRFIEKETGIPIYLISYSPEPEHTFRKRAT
jgi:adenylosuccinate synthase